MGSKNGSKWLAVFAIVALVAVFVVGCSSSPATGSMTISPTTVTSSKVFGLTVAGTGFKIGEKISILVDNALPEDFGLALAPNGDIFAIADSSGKFSVQTHKDLQVPPAMKPGTYTMQAVGKTSGTVASAQITVVAATPASPAASPAPKASSAPASSPAPSK